MSNPAVTISSASESVCFLCGNEGPVFEVTTPCGRLVSFPLCGKDLFSLVTAQSRTNAAATRIPTRGRGRPQSKTRIAGTDDGTISSDADPDAGTPADADSAAA